MSIRLIRVGGLTIWARASGVTQDLLTVAVFKAVTVASLTRLGRR